MGKSYLKFNYIFSCLVLFPGPTIAAIEKEQRPCPNVIFILADDLGYGDVGFNGQSKIQTPSLDRMAKEGMVFAQHYAGSTVCMPSRCSLMTGKHMGKATIRGNPRWTSTGVAVDLGPEDVTVAEELKRAGYTTGIIGKWGLAEVSDAGLPLEQGFDCFFGYRKHRDAHHYYWSDLWEQDRLVNFEENDYFNKNGQYTHDLFLNRALRFISENREGPFFLYLALTIPHYELTVPEDSKAPYLNLGWPRRPMKAGHYRHDPEGNVTYAGMVSRMDRDIGRLLDHLVDLGIDDETLVIFSSDNGPEFERKDRFFNSNGPFRGGKRDLYEGGIRVPLVAWWPGRIEPGSRSDHISAFEDFLPTACELAGIVPTDAITGISYVPTLMGDSASQQQHEYLYWEFNEKEGPMQAIRMGSWKGIRSQIRGFELYNLESDEEESVDVAAQYPEIRTRIENLFKEARSPHPAFQLKESDSVADAVTHSDVLPNVLLLLADDLGYGDLGCYGQREIRTPVLDALAKRGMRFTDFYAGASVCSPSRAVLMTGKHTGHATIRGNSGFFGNHKWDRVPLSKDEETLAEKMQEVGYETAFVGKWHLDDPNDLSTWAFSRGFDFAIQPNWTSRFGGVQYDEDIHYFGDKVRSVTYDAEANDCIDSFRTDLILEYLDQRNRQKPLFLFMSYRTPHAREDYIRDRDMYAERGWPEVERRYAARITLLDQEVGRLLEKLQEQGELDNTLILFTSDNGPHSEGGHDYRFFDSSGGFRGYKRDLYEGGIRVPLIAAWPGRIPESTQSSHPAAFCDIMATLADLTGFEAIGSDGLSFLPELLGREQSKHNYLYWETQLDGWARRLPDGGFRQAIRLGNWKAVRYGEGTAIELYDLAEDPYETTDISANHPFLVTRLAALLRTASTSVPHFPFGGVPQMEKAANLYEALP